MSELPQKTRADGVKGAGPAMDCGAGPSRPLLKMRSTRRSISFAARREKVSSRMRPGSAPRAMQMRHAVGQGLRLPRARAGDNQERPVVHVPPCIGRAALLGVKRGKAVRSGIAKCPVIGGSRT